MVLKSEKWEKRDFTTFIENNNNIMQESDEVFSAAADACENKILYLSFSLKCIKFYSLHKVYEIHEIRLWFFKNSTSTKVNDAQNFSSLFSIFTTHNLNEQKIIER